MGHQQRKRWLHHLARPTALICTAVILIGALAFAIRPPQARGPETPPDEFSADRALVILRELLVESEPHVAGSPLNREIRSRIQSQLRARGYEPEVQSLFHCHPGFGSCARVENIIAVKPGSEGRQAILLTAHYDSSWAAPGAGDDGAGVAALLEIAGMAMESAEARNDLVFLFTDGEELGLIGAHAFAQRHPLFEKVGAVINLEARGVTGPSTMFETGEGNRSLIRVLSKSLERPVANSLAFEVYKRMPNDTDFSVYRARGAQGLNFAFSGGVALYHSSLDDVDHLDSGSLQHHGQNAWSLVNALGDRRLDDLKSREDAAYIDVFGRVLWHYPVSIASGVTVVLTVLVLLGIGLACRPEISVGAVFWALIAQALVAVLLLGGAWLLSWPLGHWVSSHPIEHPEPWVGRLTLFALCAFVVWIACKALAHRITLGAATLVCWATIAGLAFWLDFNLPAASFVALIPLAAFFIGMLLDLLRWKTRRQLALATFCGFVAATYIALYHFFMLDAVLPFEQSHFKAAPLLLALLPFLPPCFGRFEERIPDWRPAWLIGGAVIVAALVHQLVPGFSEDRPRGMNVVYRQVEDSGLVYLESPGNQVDPVFAGIHDFQVRDVPARFSSAGVKPSEDRATMPRFARLVPSMGLATAGLDNIEWLEGEGISGHRVRFFLQAPPGSEGLVIAFPEAVEVIEARVQGVLALDSKPGNRRGRPARYLRIAYPGDDPIEVELLLGEPAPFGIAVTSRQALPGGILADFEATWPDDAQATFEGFRAEVISEFRAEAGN